MKSKSQVVSVRDMVFTALFAAVLCVAAPFSIAIGPIPLSFATLVIYLASASLGWKRAMIAVMVYVAVGAVGIPVFSNFTGGFQMLAGVTGGFFTGYILCAFTVGFITDYFHGKILRYVFGMVLGTILLYTCGTVWFSILTGTPVMASLAICVTPFLIGDTIKIIVACIAAPKLRKALESYG